MNRCSAGVSEFVAGTGVEVVDNRCLSRLVPVVAAAMVTWRADATFDLMQIEQVIGGVNGDVSAQAIQLRMRAAFQCFLEPGRLWVHDAAGANPILLFDFSVCPPFVQCVAECVAGDRVLLTSANFSDFLDTPMAADFILTNLIPESYLAAGSLTFEDSAGTIYWRLSWGGAAYSGPNDGSCVNDDSPCPNGDFGPPWPEPLPSGGVEALRFQGPAEAPSTTNVDDYAPTAGAAVFTNNAGASATITPPAPCPWDCAATPDGIVGITDFLQLLAEWRLIGTPCDVNGGGVGISDFLDLLANWGPCP